MRKTIMATWILVFESAVAGTPNSDLVFNFNDAVNGGVTSVAVRTGW